MKKRGRKSGSVSFVQVSLEELNNSLKPNARVIVWGRYASMLGLTGSPVEAKYDTLVAAVNGGTAELEITDFDNESEDIPAQQQKPQVVTNKHEHPHHEKDLEPKPSVSLEIF